MYKNIIDNSTLKKIIFLFFTFIISIIVGYFWGNLIYTHIPEPKNRISSEIFTLFRLFFFTNYLIAVIIVFLGYFTGGIISITIIFINGLSFGFGLNYTNFEKLGGVRGSVIRLIFHAPVEIFALCLMGSIGLRGFDLVKNFVLTKQLSFNQDFVTKQMVYQYLFGTFLLFIAAIIEAFVSKII